MEEGETVEDFAGRVTLVVTGIRALGDTIDEIAVVRSFLRAVPAHYMQLVTSIEQCVDLKTLTVEDHVGRYKAYDEHVRISFDDPKGSEHLLLTRTQWETLTKEKKNGEGSSSGAKKNRDRGGGRGKASDRGGGDGDEEDSSDSDTSERKFNKKNIKCYNCGIRGHFANECRKPKKEVVCFAVADDESALL